MRKELSTQKDEFTNAIAKQAESYESKLAASANKLETKLTAGLDKLDTKFVRRTDRNSRAANFNEGISRTLCFLLREMEKTIRHYHGNFPAFPWPLDTGTGAAVSMEANSENSG